MYKLRGSSLQTIIFTRVRFFLSLECKRVRANCTGGNVSCVESQAKVIAKHHRDINAIDIEYVRSPVGREWSLDTMINLPFNRREVDTACYIAYSLRIRR